MTKANHTPGPWFVGAQNDALYITAGRAPALSNDHPWHDAPRVAVAKVYGPAPNECLPVDASANAARTVACVNACEGLANPAVVPDLLALLDPDLLDDLADDLDRGASPSRQSEIANDLRELVAAIAKAKGGTA